MTILEILTHFPTTEPTVSTVPPTRCKGKRSNKVRRDKVQSTKYKGTKRATLMSRPYALGYEGILTISNRTT